MPFYNSSSSNLEDSINLSHNSVKLDMYRNISQKKEGIGKRAKNKIQFSSILNVSVPILWILELFKYFQVSSFWTQPKSTKVSHDQTFWAGDMADCTKKHDLFNAQTYSFMHIKCVFARPWLLLNTSNELLYMPKWHRTYASCMSIHPLFMNACYRFH